MSENMSALDVREMLRENHIPLAWFEADWEGVSEPYSGYAVGMWLESVA